jgi:hypothetical protein
MLAATPAGGAVLLGLPLDWLLLCLALGVVCGLS